MPAFLVPVITAAAASGGIALPALAANIIAYTVVTAATLGASYLLAQSQQKEKRDPAQVSVKQAVPARLRGYGRAKLAGAYFFFERSSAGHLFSGFVHCEGPIDGIEQWWFNDVNGEIAGGSVTVNPWQAYVSVESKVGDVPQAASGLLTSAFPDVWTADHRLDGVCYTVMRCYWIDQKNFQKVYPNGVPVPRIVARLSPVTDTRTGTAGWSQNAGLCIRDYLVHEDGARMPDSAINVASFSAFANLSDQAVSLKHGGNEPRYRLWGTYYLTEEPRTVLQRLLQTCDAELVPMPDGTIGIAGGQWTAPTFTIDDSMIIDYAYEQGSDKLAAFNRVKLTYTSPAHDYQPTETEAWENIAAQELTGEVLVQDLTLPMVPAHGQARRLAKIYEAKGNPEHKLRLTTTLAGLNALGQRIGRVIISELGLDITVMVSEFEIAGDLSSCTIAVQSLDASAYAWNAAAEEGEPPPVPQTTTTVMLAPDPTGAVASLVRTEISGGVFQVRIRVTVDPLDAPWGTIGRYRVHGETDWILMEPDGDWAVISGVVADGENFDWQVAHAGYGGSISGFVSNWVNDPPDQIVATADGTPPAILDAFAVSAGAGVASVTWTNPASANFWASRIYRGLTSDFNDATLIATVYGTPGQPGSFNEALPAGTYSWFATAINRSNMASAAVGPETHTVT